MQDILDRVNRIPGVRGTLIIGGDGLLIAADVADAMDTDSLGALASSVIATVSGALDRLQQGALRHFVMSGTAGSVVLGTVGPAILLTLVRKDANMGMVLVELKAASTDLAVKLA